MNGKGVDILKEVKLVFDTKGKSLNEIIKQILVSKAR